MNRRWMCIRGTQRTNTKTGGTYECVGRFICPLCGHPSTILMFAPPVRLWRRIQCWKCKKFANVPGRFGHSSRFIPLNDNPPEVANATNDKSAGKGEKARNRAPTATHTTACISRDKQRASRENS